MPACIFYCDLTVLLLLPRDIKIQVVLWPLDAGCVRDVAFHSVSPLLVRNVTLQIIVTETCSHYNFLAMARASWNTVQPLAASGMAAIYVRAMLPLLLLSADAVCWSTAPCSIF